MKPVNIKRIKQSCFSFFILIISMSFQPAQQGSLLFSVGVDSVVAEEVNFDAKLDQLEERTKMLRMVIKKLTRTFKKAQKNHDFLVANGMPKADIDRLEAAFQKKMQHMINEAIIEIGKI